MLHKRFDFTQQGGFPFNQDTLRYMQESYADLSSVICKLVGNNAIVDGVVTNGNNISDGWIVYNGELMPFKGGSKKNYFEVVELPESLSFKDGASKPVKFKKVAQLSGSNGIKIEKMKRVYNLLNAVSVTDRFERLVLDTEFSKEEATGNIYVGKKKLVGEYFLRQAINGSTLSIEGGLILKKELSDFSYLNDGMPLSVAALPIPVSWPTVNSNYSDYPVTLPTQLYVDATGMIGPSTKGDASVFVLKEENQLFCFIRQENLSEVGDEMQIYFSYFTVI